MNTTTPDPESVRMWMQFLAGLPEEEIRHHANSKSPTVREAATRVLAAKKQEMPAVYIPEPPRRPTEEQITEKQARVDANLRKPPPPAEPNLREIAARLSPLIDVRTSEGEVVCMVCDAICIDPLHMMQRKSRDKRHSLALGMASWLMRERQRKAFSVIGLALNGRTHSTVISACRRMSQLINKEARNVA